MAEISRRGFLRALGLGSAVLLTDLPAWAQGQSKPDFNDMMPADKKLDPAWVKALFERGEPRVYRGPDLKFVGMPIGGICCGELYLGGDGRLWNWDIFNHIQDSGCNGPRYRKPTDPEKARPVEQAFFLQIESNSSERIVPLDATGFPDVSFQGSYPTATIEYKNSSVPVEVVLESFSPFIPLDTDDSSIPATIFHFTVKNVSDKPLSAILAGTLQNAVGLKTMAGATRTNQIADAKGFSLLDCTLDPKTASTEPPPVASTTPGGKSRPDSEMSLDPAQRSDYGTMSLALLGSPADSRIASIKDNAFSGPPAHSGSASNSVLVGSIGRKLQLEPGQSTVVTFVLSWCFPNLVVNRKFNLVGRYYGTKFSSSRDVAQYVADNLDRLSSETRLWRDTWYDSTLPYWFLDRTFANTSILSTSTPYRLADGRFYSWEGVGSCPGTCTHVWHYAQAVARLFPDLERDTRERVDLGLGFNSNSGVIGFRGEYDRRLAVDGQSGTILRFYREHQMTANDEFLKKNWPRIKQSFDPLFQLDSNEDGILEGGQMNTLDTPWYGKIAWLSGMYVAALRAGEQMALEVGDNAFSSRCAKVAEAGTKNITEQLFNGEYFANIVDPAQPNHVNSGTGCEIDQVLGQSWAFQVGLPRVLPEKETRSALQSLWRYNFSPDIGVWRKFNQPGRWYAADDEMGLIMCSFPKPDWDFEKASGNDPKSFAYYFDECMTGFEYQVASHMINEGFLQEGLAITRAVHDRYHPSKRNPYNEIECGDHYSRAMASYGVFLAACGFEYHGPKGHLGFAPKLTPEDFRAPFTTAEGWGTYSQQLKGATKTAEVDLKWGRLKLKTLALALPAGGATTSVQATLDGANAPSTYQTSEGRLIITFANGVVLGKGQKLALQIS